MVLSAHIEKLSYYLFCFTCCISARSEQFFSYKCLYFLQKYKTSSHTFPGCSRKWKPYLLPPVLIVGKITKSFSRKTAEKEEEGKEKEEKEEGWEGVLRRWVTNECLAKQCDLVSRGLANIRINLSLTALN